MLEPEELVEMQDSNRKMFRDFPPSIGGHESQISGNWRRN
jgi:hypothetical protein